ncbi:GyrI-like domain-containing protein [Paenarthrobacter sp. OM7]|uniref:GyrI-like domain-containing protein n=1 Tax=Paenarthrobacter sp. OM7 TaxID=3041264 RepID=UPI0024689B0E|nr:GyrI-like domain-containing protein [Paenarthrobacter sp. OM7]WGM22829.1 GyrI-like domain-containing protein [Paenarthrobacter sp. OM7]
MSQIEIIEKSLPAVRLAARRAVVADQPEVASVVGPSFDAVAQVIGDERGTLKTPVALYETIEDGLQIIAGYAYTGPARAGIEIIELPGVENAVCGVHLGSMEHIAESWQALHAEIFARGLVHSGPCRELYVRAVTEDQSDWVTELQQPVRRR